MTSRWRRLAWPLAKALLGLLILFFIGRQFVDNLSRLDLTQLTIQPGWLVASGLLYLAGLGWSALYWFCLLRFFGDKPSLPRTIRAYYLGHFGKYVPGKAWALLLRGYLVQGPEVRLSVAMITAFYEVLTTMASGALLAAVLFAVAPPRFLDDSQLHPAVFGLLLLALVGVPLMPGIFNFMVRRLVNRLPTQEPVVIRPMNIKLLLFGLCITSWGWVLLGLSLWAMIRAIEPQPTDLWQLTAMMCLSYVSGFLAFMLPSGVGVREEVLKSLLAPELAGGTDVATLVVVLLRLAWTVAELVMAAAVFFLGRAKP